MATTINYGPVTLDNVLTAAYRQEIVYDPSRTDKCFERWTIVVDTVITASNFGKTIGATATVGSTPSDVLGQIRYILNQPRLPFKLTGPDGVVQIETSGVDCDNGPKVLALDVTQMMPAAFRVRWTVEVCAVLCPSLGVVDLFSGTSGVVAAPAASVLVHKWNHEESSDEEGNRRRVWNGTIRTINQDIPPAYFKHLCFPPLARGYARESQRFVQSENGLEGAYQIVDRIIDYSAPYPLTKFNLRHTVSTSYEGTGAYLVDVNCHAKGLAGADREVLIGTALQLMMTRIGEVQADGTIRDAGGARAVLLHSMLENNFSNERLPLVGASMRFQLTASEQQKKIGLPTLKLGEALNVNNWDRWTSHGMGTAAFDPTTPVGAWFMYVQSPCGGPKGHRTTYTAVPPEGTQAGIDQNSQLQPNQESRPEPEPSAQFGTLPEVPNDPTPTKTSQLQLQSSPYESYYVTTSHQQPKGKVAFPRIATSSSDQSTVVVATRHLPTTLRVVEVRGERINEPVQIPTFADPQGSTLLHVDHHHEAPQLSANGLAKIHRGGATLTYILDKAMEVADALIFGTPPWMLADQNQSTTTRLQDIQTTTILNEDQSNP